MGSSETQPKNSREPRKRGPLYLALEVSLIVVVLALLSLVKARPDVTDFYPYGDSCGHNLKTIFMISDYYARDHGGVFPELSPVRGELAVREDANYPGIRPQLLDGVYFLTCPTARILRPRKPWFGEAPPPPPELNEVSSDRCYFYLGYVIRDQSVLEGFAQAYRERVEAGLPFDEDLDVVIGSNPPITIPRLRAGISGVSDTQDARARIPVFVERYPNGHIPEIGYVVYLDGRAEWIKWGEKWPLTQEAMDVLLALDAMGNMP